MKKKHIEPLQKHLSNEYNNLWKPYMAKTKVKVGRDGWVKPNKNTGSRLESAIDGNNLAHILQFIDYVKPLF